MDRARVASIAVAFVVLGAAAAVVLAVLPRGEGTPAGPAPSPSPSASALEYIGLVPWRDAVRAAAGSRSLTIGGDGDQVTGEQGCRETNAQRAEVHETATTVEILVRGYRRAGAICTEVGHPLTLLTVHLREPLGARHLVDLADGTTHEVLTETDVAAVTSIPSGMVDAGASWDDRFPGVTRWYTLAHGASAETERFLLEIGPIGSLDAIDRPYWAADPSTTVHSHAAAVWRHSDMYNVNTLIDWRIGRLDYRVTGFGSKTSHLTEAQLVRVAQSVQIQTRPLPATTH